MYRYVDNFFRKWKNKNIRRYLPVLHMQNNKKNAQNKKHILTETQHPYNTQIINLTWNCQKCSNYIKKNKTIDCCVYNIKNEYCLQTKEKQNETNSKPKHNSLY